MDASDLTNDLGIRGEGRQRCHLPELVIAMAYLSLATFAQPDMPAIAPEEIANLCMHRIVHVAGYGIMAIAHALMALRPLH
jgi:hypothetical protein